MNGIEHSAFVSKHLYFGPFLGRKVIDAAAEDSWTIDIMLRNCTDVLTLGQLISNNNNNLPFLVHMIPPLDCMSHTHLQYCEMIFSIKSLCFGITYLRLVFFFLQNILSVYSGSLGPDLILKG